MQFRPIILYQPQRLLEVLPELSRRCVSRIELHLQISPRHDGGSVNVIGSACEPLVESNALAEFLRLNAIFRLSGTGFSLRIFHIGSENLMYDPFSSFERLSKQICV